MNRFIYICLLTLICTGFNACKKESHDAEQPDISSPRCKMSCRSFYYNNDVILGADSLFYDNDKLINIKEYTVRGGETELSLVSISRFEYMDNQVNAYYWEDGVEEKKRTINYIDGKLSSIQCHHWYYENCIYKFAYSRNLLSSYTYEEEGKIEDSVSVFYDQNGKNIIEYRWFKWNDSAQNYELVEVETGIVYDSKINPLHNSMWIINQFEDVGNVIYLFSKNNFLYSQQHLNSVLYNYNTEDYPIDYRRSNSIDRVVRYAYNCM